MHPVLARQPKDPMGCFTCSTIAQCSVIVTIVLARIANLFVSGVPTSLGLFRWRAHRDPTNRFYIGLAPAFMQPDEYRYSFEDVARTDLTGQTAVVTGSGSGYCQTSVVAGSGYCQTSVVTGSG